jgi:putative membrane protein
MNWNIYLETLIYLGTGIVIFLLFIFLLEKLTPWSLEKELIEDENVALAIII